LDAQNQLFLVLLRVFLGTSHGVTQAWETHTVATQQQLLNLQFYTPRTPRHQLLLPALIQRWCQLRFSYWLELQWNGMNNVPPPDWASLWMHITLKTDWESPLPKRHLAPLASSLAPPGGGSSAGSGDSNQISGLTNTSGSGSSGSGTPPLTPSNFDLGSVMKCVPYLEVFAPYRATGKRVREVIKTAIAAGNKLPKNNNNLDMCVSYYVKGVCNTNCGQNADHTPHSDDETARFVTWCGLAFGV
jgi:hypothetical protein